MFLCNLFSIGLMYFININSLGPQKTLGIFKVPGNIVWLRSNHFWITQLLIQCPSWTLFRLDWAPLALGDIILSQFWEAEWHPIHTPQAFSKKENFNWIPRQLVWALEICHCLWVASWEGYAWSMCVCISFFFWMGPAKRYLVYWIIQTNRTLAPATFLDHQLCSA